MAADNHKKIIEVKGLSASFGDHKVLSGVSFSAYAQQITVLLGSSGCGKTTVLKNLIGLYPIQKGSVKIMGKSLGAADEEDKNALYEKMGVFFQNGALLNSLTVAENVALPLHRRIGNAKFLIDDIVRMKLRLVNLEDAYDLFPSQLSGGMLKRAALARAIAIDPPLLFCDEPGAGLDPVSLASLDHLILNLKEQLGITVILVTHETASIRRLADRIVFLDSGKVVFEGPLEDALNAGIAQIDQFFSQKRQKIL